MSSLLKTQILKVGITNATEDQILEYIIENCEKQEKKIMVVTPNPEIVVFANKNSDFLDILNSADLALNDGVGLGVAAKILGKPLKERVTGVDLLQSLCKAVSNRPITVGFLGAKGKIAELAVERLRQRYPGLKIAFVGPEWGQEGFDQARKILGYKDTKILSGKKEKSPNILISQYPSIDILFVAYGFPKQEKWIAENLPKLDVQVMMGVGGAFDYISGSVPRAPYVVRAIGFEWLFRLIVQPWRIKRQLALIEFMWLVLRDRFSNQ